jgi:hypothetical protein
MIVDVRTFALDGRSESLDPPLRIFQTMFFATPTKVTAFAALTATSIGDSAGVAGTAGASIWKIGIARPDGRSTDTVDLSSDFTNNSGTFERCVFITFVLSLRNAYGVAVFEAQIHG